DGNLFAELIDAGLQLGLDFRGDGDARRGHGAHLVGDVVGGPGGAGGAHGRQQQQGGGAAVRHGRPLVGGGGYPPPDPPPKRGGEHAGSHSPQRGESRRAVFLPLPVSGRGPGGGVTFQFLLLPMQYRWFVVRMKICLWAMAGDARTSSSRSFFASTSN